MRQVTAVNCRIVVNIAMVDFLDWIDAFNGQLAHHSNCCFLNPWPKKREIFVSGRVDACYSENFSQKPHLSFFDGFCNSEGTV